MIEVATSHGKLKVTLYNLFTGKSTRLVKKNQILSRQVARAFARPINQASLWRLRFLSNKLINYEVVTL